MTVPMLMRRSRSNLPRRGRCLSPDDADQAGLAAGGWRAAASPASTRPIATRSSRSSTRRMPSATIPAHHAGTFFPTSIELSSTALELSNAPTIRGRADSREPRTRMSSGSQCAPCLAGSEMRKSGAAIHCPGHENRHLERQRHPRPASSSCRTGSSANGPTSSACRKSRRRPISARRLCEMEGYWCYWHGEKGYSGVGLHVSKALARSGRRSPIRRSTTRTGSCTVDLPARHGRVGLRAERRQGLRREDALPRRARGVRARRCSEPASRW